MKINSWSWIALSCLLWSLLVIFSTIYLIKERALNDIESLHNLAKTRGKLASSNTHISNIQIALKLSAFVYKSGIARAPDLRSDLIDLLEQLNHESIDSKLDKKLLCSECKEDLQSQLQNINKLVSENTSKISEFNNLYANQSRLNDAKNQKIQLHTLLAKDFSELMGSPSLYQVKKLDELAYYDSGPFKWLPKLDHSDTELGSLNPPPIENLSEKLEKLRKESRLIIEEQNQILGKIEETSLMLSNLDKNKQDIEIKIKTIVLNIFQTEISQL